MSCRALGPVRTTAVAATLAVGLFVGCTDAPEAGEPGTGAQAPATGTPASAELPATDGPSEPVETQSLQAGLSLQVEIADGEVNPPPDRVRVNQGERVRIEVSSDQADEVHLHGYDLSPEVTPSAPAVLEFTADQVGRFELEAHDQGLQLLQLVVE